MLIFIFILSFVLSEVTIGLAGCFLESYFQTQMRGQLPLVMLVIGFFPVAIVSLILIKPLGSLVILLPLIAPVLAMFVIGTVLFLRYGIFFFGTRLVAWSRNMGDRTREAMEEWRSNRAQD
jgi:hypothetical protein